MRETRVLMGMPITVEVVGSTGSGIVDAVFGFFAEVDSRFSPFREDSEVCRYDRGELSTCALTADVLGVFELAARTARETDGYFSIRRPDGRLDPSGVVKGWAVLQAGCLLAERGLADYYVEAGGDIQTAGRNSVGDPWRVGIRNPFDAATVVKTVRLSGQGIATSGSYVRGNHIYDPHRPGRVLDEVVSVTIIARDVLEADRFATAAFAMGRSAIDFIEAQPGLEGYQIDAAGIATMSSGFREFVAP